MKKHLFLFLIVLNFFNFINCQLTRISPPNSLTIQDFQPQNYLYYPSFSNGTTCSYNLKFSFEKGALYTSHSLIGTLVYSGSFYVIESFGVISLGSTISNISVTLGSLNSTYSVNITCALIDVSLISLEIDDKIKYEDRLGYYSSIKINGMDNHRFDVLQTLNTSGMMSLANNNVYIFIWSKFIFENKMNDTFTIPIVISKTNFYLTTKSFYYNVPPPSFDSQYIEAIPDNIVNSSLGFTDFGFNYSPLFYYISNTQTPVPYQVYFCSNMEFKTKLILGNKNKMKSIGSFQYNYGSKSFEILRLKDDNTSFRDIYNMNITEFPTTLIGQIQLNYVFELFSVEFSSEYRFFDYSYFITGGSFISGWPFGFISGNNNQFDHHSTFLNPFYLENNGNSVLKPNEFKVGPNLGISNLVNSFPIGINKTSPDLTKPILINYNFTRLKGNNKALITLNIVSNNGLENIQFNDIDYGLAPLVSGSNKNGTYEIIFDLFSFSSFNSFIIKCFDIYFNYFEYGNNQIITYDPIYIYKMPNYISNLLKPNSFEISFLKNNLNLLNSAGYNTMYLNSSTIDPDTPLLLVLTDPISSSYQSMESTPFYGSVPIVYDSNLKLFKCDFIVPANNIFGDLTFFIYHPNGIITNDQLIYNSSKLFINETYLDNQGPIFNYFEKINENVMINDNTLVGWKFNVTDDYNGFSSGIITVRGSLDSSKYIFKFTLKDAIDGNLFNSQYQILIPVSKQCVSQSFIITNVILTDNNNISSVYNIYSVLTRDPTINPFIKFYQYGVKYTDLSVICSPSISIDTTTPTLLSFKHSLGNSPAVDVNSFNSTITFDFSIATPLSGIKDQQLPIVYILTKRLNSVECISKLVAVDPIGSTTNFTCTATLPFGFGYPGILIFSIYGFINNAGYYFGYSTQQIESSFPLSYY
ncbi:hypothetical protein ACTA71_010477, partial [Dictyostelium dimigraforme]